MEKTSFNKKTIRDGWLHTGDLGFLDKSGRIIINGRKKDLIVTSGGDNISCQRLENLLVSFNEISQALIFGDNKPYLIALIVLSKGYKEDDLKRLIDSLNKKLNSIERIRKFIVIKEELSYENGFMTQTMKIKEKMFLNILVKK